MAAKMTLFQLEICQRSIFCLIFTGRGGGYHDRGRYDGGRGGGRYGGRHRDNRGPPMPYENFPEPSDGKY